MNLTVKPNNIYWESVKSYCQNYCNSFMKKRHIVNIIQFISISKNNTFMYTMLTLRQNNIAYHG